jgi:hypothetical protein
MFTPGGSGRVALRPRFRTNSSMPLSTATREHAELMIPLPPMNSTLSFAMLLTLNRDHPDQPGRGRRSRRPGARGARVLPGLIGNLTDLLSLEKMHIIAPEYDNDDGNSHMSQSLE